MSKSLTYIATVLYASTYRTRVNGIGKCCLQRQLSHGHASGCSFMNCGLERANGAEVAYIHAMVEQSAETRNAVAELLWSKEHAIPTSSDSRVVVREIHHLILWRRFHSELSHDDLQVPMSIL